jgi:uncharacterized protein YkwD
MKNIAQPKLGICSRAAVLLAIVLLGSAILTASHHSSTSSSNASVNTNSTATSTPAPAPVQCSPNIEPSACIPESTGEAEQSEILMWQLINRDRLDVTCMEETKGHARPLQWDARLAAVARAHSEEMARNHFFAHTGLDGSEPSMRVSKAGIQWRSTGENIAKVDTIAGAESAFMDEPKFQPNHRGNILNPDYTHVGVGVARGANGMLYITQEFAEYR